MSNLYARAVFFTADAESALKFYVEKLGFQEDWNYKEEGRAYVFQVSLLGFEIILNQVGDDTRHRAGAGRVFIGLEEDQIPPVLEHIASKGISTERREWGQPTLVVKDMDGNELFFWDWPKDDRRTAQSQ